MILYKSYILIYLLKTTDGLPDIVLIEDYKIQKLFNGISRFFCGVEGIINEDDLLI